MLEEYFGKDKSLRHYTQHLLIALGSYFLFRYLYGNSSINNAMLFFAFTFIIDLEHLFVLFVIRKKEFQGYINNALEDYNQGGIKRLIETLSVNHKKFVGLYLHSFVGYPILLIIFIGSIYLGDTGVAYSLAGVLAHLTFDVFDDYYQLGHVNNWLWMFKK